MTRHLTEEEMIRHLDARLDSTEAERVGAHFVECAECRVRVEEFRALRGLLDEWKPIDASAGFDAAVHEGLRAESARGWGWRWLRVRPALGAAIGVAILVVAVATLWQTYTPAPVQAPQVAQGESPMAAQPLTEPAPVVPEVQQVDDLAVLENPVLLENYELLAEFDILFEPVRQGKNSL